MWQRLALTLLLVGVAGACRSEPPPPYVRLQEQAPALVDLPPANAHLVVFWAAWCPPCVAEAPSLRALARRPPRGLAVVTYSHDPKFEDTRRDLGAPPDPGLHLRLDVDRIAAGRLGVSTLPASFLVVGDRLVARFDGPRDWDSAAMRRLLERLVQEAPAPDGQGR